MNPAPSRAAPMPPSKIQYLPERLAGLSDVAMNVARHWHRDVRVLFQTVDRTLWAITRGNPIDVLRRVDPARLAALAGDPEFLALYDRVVERTRIVSDRKGAWFAHAHADLADSGPVAYFCAEFGLSGSLPVYAGGLGVLAGDHLKAASDLGVPLVGVGLFYSKGYFDQTIRSDGWQEHTDEPFNPWIMPTERIAREDGGLVLAEVRIEGRRVGLGAWRVRVGSVALILLDTDFEQNDERDRGITHRLYGDGSDLRLRQEWVLGVGGVRVLRALGISPACWHANEGHSTFMMVERLRERIQAGDSLEAALPLVRSRTVFTTHTPVPAGHDTFSADQIDALGIDWATMGVDRDVVLALGTHPNDDGAFHVTPAAIRLAGGVNGVSRKHGRVTRDIWRGLWANGASTAVPIGDITNGVHLETWMARRIQGLLDETLGEGWHNADDPAWDRLLEVDDRRLWEVHLELKHQLFDFVREEARHRWRHQWTEAVHLVGAGTLLGPEPLTIGFARRFATYKRADLLFRNENRLRRLLVDPHRPVQIILAGKAHPADDQGKGVLQRIYSYTRDPSFEGRVAFVEDYGIPLARRLVQGVDLWLNVPRVPQEASGTSGMKAAMNGVPQLSTLDGWWDEGFSGDNGWAIPVGEGSDGDESDWEHLMGLLEDEIVPLYYERDDREVPLGWVRTMKHAMRGALPRFTARRMVQEYVERYYAPGLSGRLSAEPPSPLLSLPTSSST